MYKIYILQQKAFQILYPSQIVLYKSWQGVECSFLKPTPFQSQYPPQIYLQILNTYNIRI